MPSYQRGLGFAQIFFVVSFLIFSVLTGLKLIPAYMENGAIKNIFSAIAHDPDMQKASQAEIKKSFGIRSSIDDIKAINASDIEISSEDGIPYLSASYAVTIPLIANISLYLEFNPTSAE